MKQKLLVYVNKHTKFSEQKGVPCSIFQARGRKNEVGMISSGVSKL